MKTFVFKISPKGKEDWIVKAEGNDENEALRLAKSVLPEGSLKIAAFEITDDTVGKVLKIALARTLYPVIEVSKDESGKVNATINGQQLPKSLSKRIDDYSIEDIENEIAKLAKVRQGKEDTETQRKSKFKKYHVDISIDDQMNLIQNIEDQLHKVGYLDDEGNEHEEKMSKIPLTTFYQMLSIDGASERDKLYKQIVDDINAEFDAKPDTWLNKRERNRNLEFFRYIFGKNTGKNKNGFTERQTAIVWKNAQSMKKTGEPIAKEIRDQGKDIVSRTYINNILQKALASLKKKAAWEKAKSELSLEPA